jgi:CelD/BcsL family acetyltransferase involved in cellulose biosynthesis/GNAT superfamily N-acetyltransferase
VEPPKIAETSGKLIVYQDAEADGFLALPQVREAWIGLWDRCPWATGLQRPEFVCTWYRCYAERYRPLVVVRYGADGQLDGLVTLAVDRAGEELVFAGSYQAEYHTWLAPPGEQTFICAVLEEMQRRGFASLRFVYLPTGAPLDWLDDGWRQRSILEPVKKPLMDIGDGSEVRESLRKKSNKSRMNRLARNGPIEFVEVKTLEDFDRDYDQIILFNDFRQGAIHDVCPFADEPRKRNFFRELLAQPDFLHVTVMRAGGELVAAHIGFRSRLEVVLGIVCYSPFVAEHSPGKFHMLQLALLMRDEGFAAVDLTPGGDPYKDRFATRYEEAHLLTVFFNQSRAHKRRLAIALRSALIRSAASLGLGAEKLRRGRSFLRRMIAHAANPARSARSFIRTRLWGTTEMRVYRMPAVQLPKGIEDAGIHRDSLADLLLHQRDPALPPRGDILSSAMAAIEAGAHVYTSARDGRLASYGWLMPQAEKSFLPEVQQEFAYPPHSAELWNFYTHPSWRRQGLFSHALQRVLADAARVPGIEFAYISVLSDNWSSRRVIEKTGFLYQGSITRIRRFHATFFKRTVPEQPSAEVAGAPEPKSGSIT